MSTNNFEELFRNLELANVEEVEYENDSNRFFRLSFENMLNEHVLSIEIIVHESMLIKHNIKY